MDERRHVAPAAGRASGRQSPARRRRADVRARRRSGADEAPPLAVGTLVRSRQQRQLLQVASRGACGPAVPSRCTRRTPEPAALVQIVAQHVERFVDVHKVFLGDYTPTGSDILMMTNASRNAGAFGLHYGAFLPTLLSRTSIGGCTRRCLRPAHTCSVVCPLSHCLCTRGCHCVRACVRACVRGCDHG
jgi:hypothetical protein